MKFLINKPENVVTEAVEGAVDATDHLQRLDGFPSIKVVFDRRHDKYSTVSIISGGGAGHEPAFAGYVGSGMLTAAVSGDVFAAPPEEAVLAAIRQVTGPAGCLLILMNYTGDRLTFGAAAERAKAEGLAVELVVVADDCALPHKPAVGRRGIAGTLLVLKAAGAVAAAGGTLAEVYHAATRVNTMIGTMGCSLTTCAIPGREASTRLGADEMEFGLGIHGEAGAYRSRVKPVDAIVSELLAHIGDSYLPVRPGDRIGLLINNLGIATQLEMGIAVRAAVRAATGEPLKAAGVVWLGSGTLMTSLDMHGLSISIINFGNVVGENQDVLDWLDAPTDAPAWPRNASSKRGRYGGRQDDAGQEKLPVPLPRGATDMEEDIKVGVDEVGQGYQVPRLKMCIEAACTSLIHASSRLDELDAAVGDGDCGSTAAKGATAVLHALQTNRIPLLDAAAMALKIASILGQTMGGTSGAIYKIFFTAIGAELRKIQAGKELPPPLTAPSCGAAVKAGVEAVSKYGGAKAGDRTMLDAMIPVESVLMECSSSTGAKEAASMAAKAAEQGADATRDMVAIAGRSSYVPSNSLKGVPDPGAEAVGVWLRAVATVLAS